MKENWFYSSYYDEEVFKFLKETVKIDDVLLKILIKRGYDSLAKINDFLDPSLNNLHDPFLMKGMKKATEKLINLIESKEKIVIYGDYDVDGTTSVAMVYSFLKSLEANVETYIPDRYTEGYGISEKGVTNFSESGVKVILALDCGTRDIKNIKLASELGMEAIICDHHEPGDELPMAFAILNPKQKDCNYPFKELSGCGVGFKLIQAISILLKLNKKTYFKYLDLVAVSTCCDIVPLVDENRILVHYGLKKLLQSPLPGLAALSKLSKVGEKEASVSDIVFGIGPRINAAGRIYHANEALKVLIGDDGSKLYEDAAILNTINESRKEIDNNITLQAIEMLENESLNYKVKFSTVLFSENWHKGIVGIVASRCIEVFHRPTVILTKSDGNTAVGSARSIPGFNLYEALCECSDLLIKFGGHEHAAGLSLEIANIEIFKERMEQIVSSRLNEYDLIPKIKIDEILPLEKITDKLFYEINKMSPFGPKNMQPVFYCKKAKILNLEIIKDNHIKLHFQQSKGNIISGICFNIASMHKEIQHKDHISILYSIQKDYFSQGLSLRIRDIDL